MGHFNVALDPAARRHHVAFAAGSGITPVLSIIKTTLAAEPRSLFTLFYGNRASGSVMFREELAALKDRHMTRFNLVHGLSREAQDIGLLHGRIDRDRALRLLDRWGPAAEADAGMEFPYSIVTFTSQSARSGGTSCSRTTRWRAASSSRARATR